MNYIVITDIFGNNFDPQRDHNHLYSTMYPIILLHSSQPHLLLEKVDNHNDSVWQLVYPTIMHILYSQRIDPATYAPLGHIWFKQNKLPDHIVIPLVHTDLVISQYPIDFVKLDNYTKTAIWKPIGPRGYSAVGFVASSNKPSLRTIRTINNILLTEFRGTNHYDNKLTNMNEFFLLSYLGEKKFTIKRTKLLYHNDIINIISKKTRQSIAKVGSRIKPSSDDFSDIHYTDQGELVIDGKCVGVSIDDNINDNYLYLQDCNNNDSQKWYPYRDNYVSQYNQGCMMNIDDHLVTNDCHSFGNHLDARWDTYTKNTVVEQDSQDHTNRWTTERGKRVILVEPDNPWYINKTDHVQGIITPNHTVLNQKQYRKHADVYSKFMMDTNRSDLGYGYSYAQRAGKACNCVEDCHHIPHDRTIFENFNEGVEYTGGFNTIAFSLLFLVILLVIFRFYLQSSRSSTLST